VQMALNQTPVTVITGCLGAGKTTLLNLILTAHDFSKAVPSVRGNRMKGATAAWSSSEEDYPDRLKQEFESCRVDRRCICEPVDCFCSQFVSWIVASRPVDRGQYGSR
jgi:hypothetical protein